MCHYWHSKTYEEYNVRINVNEKNFFESNNIIVRKNISRLFTYYIARDQNRDLQRNQNGIHIFMFLKFEKRIARKHELVSMSLSVEIPFRKNIKKKMFRTRQEHATGFLSYKIVLFKHEHVHTCLRRVICPWTRRINWTWKRYGKTRHIFEHVDVFLIWYKIYMKLS